MWWIEEYECNNIGPFGPDNPQKFVLKQGMVGLIGANGGGKSTVVESMVACITGDWSGFGRTKADCINHHAKGKSKSFVRVTLNRDGRRCKITRSLRPVGQEMVLDGLERPLTSDAAIKEKLAELGIDRQILDFCVFKRQNQIYDFLSGRPAQRAEAYAVLCRMRECEKIWNLLGVFCNQASYYSASILDNSDILAQTIADTADRLGEIDNELSICNDIRMSTPHRNKAREWLARADRLAELKERRVLAAHKVGHLRDDCLPDVDKLWARRRSNHDEVRRQLSRGQEAAELASEALAAWERNRLAANKLQAARDEKAELEKELADRILPQPPIDSLPPEELAARKEESIGQRALCISIIGYWVDGQTDLSSTYPTACPACGQTVKNSRAKVDRARQDLADLDAEIARINQAIREWRDYHLRMSYWNAWHTRHQMAMKYIEENIADAVIYEPEVSVRDAEATLAAHKQLEKEEAIAARKVDEISREHEKLTAQLEAALSQLEQIDSDIVLCTIPPENLDSARQRLQEDDQASHDIARLSGERDALLRTNSNASRQLTELEAQLRRNKRIMAMARVVAIARDAVHRERLPARVAQGNLIRLEGDINASLEHFGRPFWVEATDDLSFLVHKPGEPPHRAEWLSGGQQVILAIAFWDAVGSLFRDDIGMLVLDEPTANLDGVNVAYLAEAMAAMTISVRGKRQIIVVTHAESLVGAFDQVVEIGG